MTLSKENIMTNPIEVTLNTGKTLTLKPSTAGTGNTIWGLIPEGADKPRMVKLTKARLGGKLPTSLKVNGVTIAGAKKKTPKPTGKSKTPAGIDQVNFNAVIKVDGKDRRLNLWMQEFPDCIRVGGQVNQFGIASQILDDI